MDLQDNHSPQRWKNRDLANSIKNALKGLLTVFKEERNMKKHVVSAVLVVVAGLIFQVSMTEWLFLLLAISLVLAFEVINSALENVVDLINGDDFSPHVKRIKDMAAGAVLLISLCAFIVGVFIFLPKLFALFLNFL